MLRVQPPPSMPFPMLPNSHKQLPHFDGHCRAAGVDRLRRGEDCTHTPPLLGERSNRHSTHGLATPPQEGSDMYGINGNPTLNAHIGSQQYQRAPVIASNAPPYPTTHTTIDNGRSSCGPQPFYNTYHSARRPQSPVLPPKDPASQSEQMARRRTSSDGNIIASHLQIPSAINDSKGSLPEFAAQITCFFWFESSYTLHLVENTTGTSSTSVTPLVPEASPTTGFRKWVTTILSMTQVSQNVILLALMFIYRLKRLNPAVKGKIGSEFRLLTVALMLGNKFLDDNTYTNKTWAEVSGISVQEIHVMEVEFLSNMRYTLFASEREWEEWHVKLKTFSDYYDKASRSQQVGLRSLALPAPECLIPRDLPTPPASTNTSPPFLTHLAANPSAFAHPLSMPPSLAPRTLSPDHELRMLAVARKRSLEDDGLEPPSKRLNSLGASAASSTTLTPSTLNNTPPVPRLPMPNLSIPVSNPSNSYGSSIAQLPPSTARAMSTVFPGPHAKPQHGIQLPSLPTHGYLNRQANTKSSTPTPYTSATSTPSPTSFHFPQHTSNGLSPSGWPAPRNSPYKPIRGVNTLLVPPPSASIQNHPQNVSYGQMHYQPLGKPPSERRTGVLPNYSFNTWSQPHHLQHHLPQPNFAS